jgi:dihydrofolate synthase / folylpolyglutamate synthase
VSSPDSLPTDLAGWLAYIESQHPKSIEMGLDRVLLVKQRLKLAPNFPIITVAGTNGKGSTCAMLASVYVQAGYRVASYTSPHLLRYNERVRIQGEEVEDALLIEAFRAVEMARHEVSLTYFEFATLAAVWLFQMQAPDVAILEVGLGGRLDAVNAFDPDCAIVTGIDLDHMDYLGDTREKIAFEKAGVFRAGVPAICGDPDPPQSLLRHASAIGADLMCYGREFRCIAHTIDWTYDGSVLMEHLPMPNLIGEFQLNNAACVITAIEALQKRLPVNAEAIAAGLVYVRLAGRFERIGDSPETILDVAHNPQAARVLAENLRMISGAEKIRAVFGVLADKDIEGVIEPMVALVNQWYVAAVRQPRGASAEHVMDALRAQMPDANAIAYQDLTEAYAQACRDAGKNDKIIVFGSFFTVSEIMLAMRSLELPG